MDRAIFIAMTGATQTMRAQAENSNNLANANTVGFKAQVAAFQSVPVLGEGYASRINAVSRGVGVNMAIGPQIDTGRQLDVAVQGQGWIAVQAPDGSEAYTRAGALHLSPAGMLTTARGMPVLGDNGPITVPAYTQLKIGGDGTISVIPTGQSPAAMASIGRIKLVNPAVSQLVQGADGLMHMRTGNPAPADASVHLASGVLEGSNVNPVDALVRMIALTRQYEMQVRTIQTENQNAQAATRLLSLN